MELMPKKTLTAQGCAVGSVQQRHFDFEIFHGTVGEVVTTNVSEFILTQ